MPASTPIEDRLWKNVSISDGCWLWIGSCDTGGYGTINNKCSHVRVHRFSYEIFNGPIPEGLLVCHKCDVRRCVRPSHLFLGTYKDNSDDKISKGRNVILTGERIGLSKLTEKDVVDIRIRYAEGNDSHRIIAKDYGVTRATIGRVISRKTWNHVL